MQTGPARDHAPRAILTFFLILTVALTAVAPSFAATTARELEGERYLPIGLTPEEEARLDEIGIGHVRTAPAAQPVRNPGEFEPMTGVIVRYPFGNPTDLLVEYAEEITLWVIVEDASDQSSATSTLSAGGCNMANVDWIFAPTNSIWTRDYGPWFIIDGDGDQGIVDHIYNRPRPDDDLVPGVIGSDWSIPVYGLGITHTGGNYMADGRGVAISTELVLNENSGLSEAEIDEAMHDYLGIETYHKLDYIESGGIHHIDCWAKFLSPSKILVREVPSGHSSYAALEANVAYLESVTNSYGRPYEIVRVYTPNDEPYTNSIILNDRVFVPMYGTAWDDDAIDTYEAAMPGYEILGYDGSWLSDDAIHCRAMGVTDRLMLYIDHVPHYDTATTTGTYDVVAGIDDLSGAGLVADSLLVYWKTDGMPDFSVETMVGDAKDGTYSAEIPAQAAGTTISYYIFAKDLSGRRETHPWVAPGDVHSFDVVVDGEAPAIDHTPIGDTPASAWPPTAVATVTDNLDITSVVLEASINGTPRPDVAMERTPGTFDYEAAFPGTVSVGDVVTYRVRAEDGATPPNTSYDPPSSSHSFQIVDSIPVLLCELDPTPGSVAVLATILDGLGIAYDTTTSFPTNMSEYDAVFICLGIYPNNVALNSTEAGELVAYLDGGGHAYMEGGDCWAYDSSRTIYNGHFGVDGLNDGSGDLATVVGQAGTLAEGMSFSYSGENRYMDKIDALGGADVVFRNSAGNAGCGVSNDAGIYATVACAFEFAGLDDGSSPSTKGELLEAILDFFGVMPTDVPDGELPGARRLALHRNHPNPFNPRTTIAFELPSAGETRLAVYSASGRHVATLVEGTLDAGRHTVTWNGIDDAGRSVASGVYFFRLDSLGETRTGKGVLLK